jgi:hypothetical protein
MYFSALRVLPVVPFPIPACTAAERRLWARKRADDSVPDSASVGIIIICCGRTTHRIVQAKLGTLLREAGTQGFQSRESLAVAVAVAAATSCGQRDCRLTSLVVVLRVRLRGSALIHQLVLSSGSRLWTLKTLFSLSSSRDLSGECLRIAEYRCACLCVGLAIAQSASLKGKP